MKIIKRTLLSFMAFDLTSESAQADLIETAYENNSFSGSVAKF